MSIGTFQAVIFTKPCFYDTIFVEEKTEKTTNMDEEKEKSQINISEKEILSQSSANFFRIFNAYRKEKIIGIGKLVQGLMSSRAFLDIQKGKSMLSRDDWELLMQRMGVVTDYFEVIVSRKELEDWRRRENICLFVWEKPDEAVKLLEQYRKINQT